MTAQHQAAGRKGGQSLLTAESGRQGTLCPTYWPVRETITP